MNAHYLERKTFDTCLAQKKARNIDITTFLARLYAP